MSLDLNKLRQKLEQLKNPKLKTSKFDKKTWSPDKTRSKVVRFFQDPTSSDPFHELYFHYNIIKAPILCPRTNNDKQCPICSFAFDLKNKSDAEHKPFDKETFKKLMPKQRFFGLVLDREDETLTPKWWGFGTEIYQFLIEALCSDDWGVILNEADGHDAEVSVITKTGAKFEYNAPKLVFKKKQTKLLEDSSRLKQMYESITPLSEVFKPLTNVEIQAALGEWLNLTESDGAELTKGGNGTQPEEGISTDSDGAELTKSGKTSHVSTDSDVTYKDLDAAFQKALSDD